MPKILKVLSVNINGGLFKLDTNIPILNYFLNFDFVFLNELKCDAMFTMPGFVTIRSNEPNGSLRGGVAVLVKTSLAKYVQGVEMLQDQVWFRLSFWPNCILGGCYIPPADSPYFTPGHFANIQARAQQGNTIVIGDLNSRMADLSTFDDDSGSYSTNPDKITNTHGRELKRLMLNNDLVPVNCLTGRLGCQSESALTYRKGTQWVSQLDWVICTKQLREHIQQLKINHNHPLKSDHAALELTLIPPEPKGSILLNRATLLGNHNIIPKVRSTTHTVHTTNVNSMGFKQSIINALSLTNAEDMDNDDYNQVLIDIVSSCAEKNKINIERNHIIPVNANQRWNYLLNIPNHKEMWKAIDWAGAINEKNYQTNNNRPDDNSFAAHLAALLNPPILPPTLINIGIYIPLLDDPISLDETIRARNLLKANKAPGHHGINPGLLKMLPDESMLTVQNYLNKIFNGQYPKDWDLCLTTMIYKKGDPQ